MAYAVLVDEHNFEKWMRSVEEKLDRIMHAQYHVLDNQERMMAALDKLQAAVTAENTVIDSAVVLIQGLAQQIKDLEPNQAAIDQLAADVTVKADALAAAVAAGTTPAA